MQNKQKALLISGFKSCDKIGNKIINSLKNKVSLFGVGGKSMKSNSFQNFGDIDLVQDKQFHLIKNMKTDFRNPLFISLLKLNYDNFKLFRDLKKNKFWSNFEQESLKDIKMIFTIGNPNLCYWMNHYILQIFQKQNLTRPISIHLDQTKRLLKVDDHDYLDYFINTLPHQSISKGYYSFPGKFIGKQVIYDAFKFLYSQNDKYKDLISLNQIYINKSINHLIMEELIFSVRQKFRMENKIKEEDTVIFISPGNQKEEIINNLNISKKAIQTFLNRFAYGKQKLDNFKVIISLEEKSKEIKQIVDNFKDLKVDLKIIYGNKNNQRYEAMAGSDIGACQDGDSVLECSVFQMMFVILNNKSFAQSYLSLLYNVYESPINTAEDKSIYPELMGRMFPEKIVEFWSDWFKQPKLRYKKAIESNKVLLKLLPETQDSQNKGLQIDPSDFTQYSKPDYELDTFLNEITNKTNKIVEIKEQDQYLKEEKRMEILGREFQFNFIIMEEPQRVNRLEDLDKMFPNSHQVEMMLAKLQKRIVMKRPMLMKIQGSQINIKTLNKNIMYNLENKINPKLSAHVSEQLELIINELDFNNYEAAFEKLIDLINMIEDSL